MATLPERWLRQKISIEKYNSSRCVEAIKLYTENMFDRDDELFKILLDTANKF